MKNYIKIGNKKIEISEETANNLKSQFSDKIKIEDNFYWYKKENENIDTAKIISIGGYADLQGCSGDLSSLESIGGSAYLQGYSGDLYSLGSIGGSADLRGYSGDLSSLESIGGYADLQGYSKELKKSLAKTLKECGNIYVEFIDEPMTLEEFKEYAEKL